ncbi:MAG: 3-oxoacyl-ACP synthase [Gemmatimonadetes bacterium]|nr:3-oxoacyl-ACP synthase [Gemmatimonadota bacterium]
MAETEKKFRAAITATARFLPDKVVTNADIEKLVDTSDEWIRTRTGIVERRFLEEDEPTSKMAIAVGADLLRKRGLSGDDIDLIIVATITPDMVFPATACLVQHGIGANRAWAYDLSAACSGFVYAITAGAQFIETGAHRRVMVIGADKMSMLLDFTDRTTCVLFGDGAGGVILERSEDGAAGLLDFELYADGSSVDCLYVKAGGSRAPATHQTVDAREHYVRQEGATVFKFAVSKMAEVSVSLIERNGLTGTDLKLFVPHQANKRIIDAAAERMDLPKDRVVLNIDRCANTTAATIPIALSEADDDGRLQSGDLLLMTGVGGGLTWGSALFRWGH